MDFISVIENFLRLIHTLNKCWPRWPLKTQRICALSTSHIQIMPWDGTYRSCSAILCTGVILLLFQSPTHGACQKHLMLPAGDSRVLTLLIFLVHLCFWWLESVIQKWGDICNRGCFCFPFQHLNLKRVWGSSQNIEFSRSGLLSGDREEVSRKWEGQNKVTSSQLTKSESYLRLLTGWISGTPKMNIYKVA